MTQEWRIRPAEPDDVPAIDELVRELAEYEREPDAVEATPDDLAAALFGPDPRVHCHVAEMPTPTGRPQVIGIALWYVTFSTWKGRHGVWLEDLYVRPRYRRNGVAAALLGELAALCTRRGYARLEWWVLDWNSPAQAFYRTLGATPEDEWTVWRLTGDALSTVAGSAMGSPGPGTAGEARPEGTGAGQEPP